MPFAPGQSGNPGGRPKLPNEVKELARAASERAISRAIELMESPDENVALKAISTVLDRGYGKPAQAVTGEDGRRALEAALMITRSLQTHWQTLDPPVSALFPVARLRAGSVGHA